MPRSSSIPLRLALVASAVLAAACSRAPEPAAAPAAATASAPVPATPSAVAQIAKHQDEGIAWIKATGPEEVERAFAQARGANKPVFVYWGAVWCPPCNQVKATIFNRDDFIEKSRAFVPIYLDGDLPGAQKLGEKFKVRGYPTMILFRPDGSELTRLPGEVDARKYLQVLSLGLGQARPVKEVLGQALRQPKRLSAEDWRLLAYYSWDTDEQQLLAPGKQADTLARLAAACPPTAAQAGQRLGLKALVARADDEFKGRTLDAGSAAAARDGVLALLADDAQVQDNLDIVTNYAAELVKVLSAKGTPEREQFAAAFATTLDRLTADTRLSQGDRIGALISRIAIAQLDDPKAALSPVLLEHVRAQVARADREVTSDIERQSVITSAGHALSKAGLLDESDTLLEAEIKRSHSPYYSMLQLASNAKKRGDKAAALRWYERAYAESKGPATRVQWGANYVTALVDLAPQDAQRIEQAAASVYAELDGQRDAFYERNARSLERINAKLAAWATTTERRAATQRLRAALDQRCVALPSGDAQRATCGTLGKQLAGGKPAAKSATT